MEGIPTNLSPQLAPTPQGEAARQDIREKKGNPQLHPEYEKSTALPRLRSAASSDSPFSPPELRGQSV